MVDFEKIITALTQSGIRFIVVGGAAATAHGSARLTQDLDIVYERSKENIANLVKTLSPYKPYLRGAPLGLPFIWDEETILKGLNFTLITSLGALDLLGEITGGGSFEDLLNDSVKVELFGTECLVLNLKRLIEVKRAAGRIRDLEVIAELEALLEESNSQ
jgi:predicted nucleotidyltransferase